jgi:chromosome segregation ATPase
MMGETAVLVRLE